MQDTALITLYLARRDAYAAFLTAVDAERTVIWHRQAGRHPSSQEALEAVDHAYDATRGAYNVIDGEGVGPVKEGRALLEQLSAMESGDLGNPDWHGYHKAREAFLSAATKHLGGLLPED